MATITARGCHQVAAFTTERILTRDGTSTTYCERWVLRSDGALLTRICWTDDHGEPRWYTRHRSGPRMTSRLDHTSGLHVRGTVRNPANVTSDWLRGWLARKGYTITREG